MQLKLLILAICVSATFARPSAEGKHANPHREQLAATKIIYYLGKFNNKTFYIGGEQVTQEEGRSICQASGYDLAVIGIQEELNFLYDTTFPEEDYAWTSASQHFGNSAFHFDDGSAVNDAIDVNNVAYLPAYGLGIDRFSNTTDLLIQTAVSLRYYLCSSQA